MSETVHYKGKLIPVEMVGSVEETAKSIAVKNGINISADFYEDWEEGFSSNYYKEYVIIDDKIYEVEMCEVDEYDIFNASKNADGTIDVEVMYYNGGCSFDEAIEKAMESVV